MVQITNQFRFADYESVIRKLAMIRYLYNGKFVLIRYLYHNYE